MSSPAASLKHEMNLHYDSFIMMAATEEKTGLMYGCTEEEKANLVRRYESFFKNIHAYITMTPSESYACFDDAFVNASMMFLYVKDAENTPIAIVYSVSERILDLRKVSSLPRPLDIQPDSINGKPLEQLTFPPDHD